MYNPGTSAEYRLELILIHNWHGTYEYFVFTMINGSQPIFNSGYYYLYIGHTRYLPSHTQIYQCFFIWYILYQFP